MEIKTISKLNGHNIQIVSNERDKLRLSNTLKKHPLLYHFERSLWPVLFTVCQLEKLIPEKYSFETEKHSPTQQMSRRTNLDRLARPTSTWVYVGTITTYYY